MSLETFPIEIKFNYPFAKIPQFDTRIVNYGNKIEQRISMAIGPRYSFKATLSVKSRAQADIILAFFIARKGAFESFNLLSPQDGLIYVVRFKEDVLNMEYVNYLLYNYGIVEFIEVA